VIAGRKKSRAETDSVSLTNMREVYSILRSEYEKYCTKAEIEYKRYDLKIERLEQEIEKLKVKLHEMEAIAEEFRRCSFYIEKGKCPVKDKKYADVKGILKNENKSKGQANLSPTTNSIIEN
jgi:phenylalanyl-tRNA synthetase alpha subunit